MPACGLLQIITLIFQRTFAIKHENYLQLSLLQLYLPHEVVSQVKESTHNILPKLFWETQLADWVSLKNKTEGFV